MNLVLIETSGNQQYIFSTNKLRENVGASELTYRAGTEWVLDAVHRITKEYGFKSLWPGDESAEQLRNNLLDKMLNPPIEDPNNKLPVEVIIATSGKALLLVKDADGRKSREIGKQIVSEVTISALKEAPGIDVCGVISDGFDWNACPLGNINRRVHEIFEEARASRPTPALRFLRLPVVAECATSGLPAAEWDDRDKNDVGARSTVSLAKRNNREKYVERMQMLLDRDKKYLNFARNISELEKKTDWIAVIHADGNGVGEIFLSFGEHTDCENPDQNREYVNKLRQFSLALDRCTEEAFKKTLHEWVQKKPDVWSRLPLLPIVLGGDDLTVVCDGHAALPLTERFLVNFEIETARSDEPFYKVIQDVAQKALGAPRLSACAGVSVIKPHYPFSSAYELAEDLIRSAKRVKNIVKLPVKNPGEKEKTYPCSALDFHIHYDTSGSDLDEIRERLALDEPEEQINDKETREVEVRLFGRPYVVTKTDDLNGAKGKAWATRHHWGELEKRVQALIAKDDDGRRKLPNSQMHELRAGLFLGREATNARYRLVRHRYIKQGIKVFDEDGQETLFRLEDEAKVVETASGKVEQVFHTSKLLDALDAATLLEEWMLPENPNGGEK